MHDYILVTLLGQSKPPRAIVVEPGHDYFAVMLYGATPVIFFVCFIDIECLRNCFFLVEQNSYEF